MACRIPREQPAAASSHAACGSAPAAAATDSAPPPNEALTSATRQAQPTNPRTAAASPRPSLSPMNRISAMYSPPVKAIVVDSETKAM